MKINVAFNRDCMDAMKEFPDGFFDLAVVDPPYGDGCSQIGNVERESYNRFGQRFDRYKLSTELDSTERTRTTSGGRHLTSGRRKGQSPPDWWNVGGEIRKKIIAWDVAPKQEYFDELFRVSRNQIIWGGNYFGLPPTRCFLVWRKTNVPLEGFSMAAVEYAWTSFNQNAMVFEFSAINQPGRFHPTQKPPELYNWIFKHFAKDGYKILDTHLGSGSSRIAAYDANLDFWGYEIDETYFQLQEERFARHTAQTSLFIDGGDF